MDIKWLLFFAGFFLAVGVDAFAIDEKPETDSSGSTTAPAPPDPAQTQTQTQGSQPKQDESAAPNKSEQPKKPRGRVAREKEAEGTEAPNRFNNTDIIIKSQYELNGQPLEVDTD